MQISRLLVLTATVALAAAAPASAQDAPETSPNVKFLENNAYPLKYDMPAQEGTDLEFATITLPGGGATPAKPNGPGTPATPATPPAKPIKSKKKANQKKYAACVKKANKRYKGKKNAKKRAKAVKLCKKKYRSSKALRMLADVSPRAAGVQRTYAFAGSYTNGLHIYDVSDPVNPELVTHYDCAISQGDVQVFQRNDLGGRWFVTYTSDGGADNTDSACVLEADAAGMNASGQNGSGTYIIDVTNPAAPKTVSFVFYAKGSHNQTVHPSGKFLYNSNSDLVTDPTPGIEITDISNLTAPKEVTVFDIVPLPGLGSNAHDIWFTPDGSRAYVAAVTSTIILDTADPANPKQISRIPNEYNVSHQAETIEADVPGLGKRTILLVADEFAGATGTNQCPNGGLHVYDVSPEVESAPIRLGYFNITAAGPTDNSLGRCTAHVFQLHRDQNLMLIGWYNQGFRVLDLASLAGISFGAQGTGIVELGYGRFAQGEAWAGKSPAGTVRRDAPFSVYTNDTMRGFDAWQVDLRQPARRSAGSMKVEFVPAALEAARTRTTAGATTLVCRLGM
jgi:hypothetical protein